MNPPAVAPSIAVQKPTRVRYGVLAFACSLSMITYLDRVCFSQVTRFIVADFKLTELEKGILFWAFAFAYAAFEIPSGWLGDMFGARRTLIRIVLLWSVFTALTGSVYPSNDWPTLAFGALVLVRFLFGMGEAGAYPNIARAFHNWFPFEERGFAKGAVWMAGRLGGGLTPLIFLILVKDSVGDDGKKVTDWRHTFWIFGGVGVVWCLFFSLWYRDRPEQKSGVNKAEFDLIRGKDAELHAKPTKVPWKKLFTNRNLWFLCVMYCMGAYGWYFNITYLPDFLRDYYGVTEGDKWSEDFWRYSLMTGMPLLLGSVACLLGGTLSDIFIRTTGNRKWGRRLFGVVGMGFCSLCYFSCIFVDSPWGIVWAVSLAAFCNDLTMGASWASCLDIGGRFSGIVAGCMNSIGNLGGAAAGILTGWIVTLYTGGLAKTAPDYIEISRPGWTWNFVVFGGVYVVAMIMWFLFDSTKQVPQE